MKRFAWNFELNLDKPFAWNELTPILPDSKRWEARFFWPEHEIVVVHGLESYFLDLSRYDVKHREDVYFLMPNNDLNLKIRRDKLLYKPVHTRSSSALAYGKKIKLNEEPPQTRIAELPEMTIAELLRDLNTLGHKISVSKEALIYKIPTSPEIKLEFAKLEVRQKTYFSLSIETNERSWIEPVCQHLLGKQAPCDYVTFLKGIFPL